MRDRGASEAHNSLMRRRRSGIVVDIEANGTETGEVVLEDAIGAETTEGGLETDIVENPALGLRDAAFLAVRNGIGLKMVAVRAIHRRMRNSIRRNRNPRIGAGERIRSTGGCGSEP